MEFGASCINSLVLRAKLHEANPARSVKTVNKNHFDCVKFHLCALTPGKQQVANFFAHESSSRVFPNPSDASHLQTSVRFSPRFLWGVSLSRPTFVPTPRNCTEGRSLPPLSRQGSLRRYGRLRYLLFWFLYDRSFPSGVCQGAGVLVTSLLSRLSPISRGKGSLSPYPRTYIEDTFSRFGRKNF